MFNSLMKLAVDASHVVGLRMMKLVRGGGQARREAELELWAKVGDGMKG